MRTNFVFSTVFFLSSVLAAPVPSVRPRGFIMSGLNEVLEAAEIAISRISGEEHLIQGIENLSKMNSGGLERVSAEQASALMFAAERGDSKVVKLLDEAIWTARTWGMSMSDDLSRVADRYDEEFLRPSPWRANVIDKAAVTVKGGWDKLSWQAKFALVAALGVGGTGTAVPSALGGAAGVRQAIKSGDKSYVLPTKLTDEDMTLLKQYITGHPDRYPELLHDINEKVTGLTDRQRKELVEAAPKTFVDDISAQMASKSSNEELN